MLPIVNRYCCGPSGRRRGASWTTCSDVKQVTPGNMIPMLVRSLTRSVRGKGRVLLGALAGYVVMAFVLFVLFTLAYLILGADGSFAEGSWDVSGAWIVVSIVGGLAAAFAGGFVCHRVARRMQGVWVLVALIVILGIAVAQVPGEATAVMERMTDPGLTEAMNNAQQPAWMHYLNPILGVVGVLFGSGTGSRRLRSGATMEAPRRWS